MKNLLICTVAFFLIVGCTRKSMESSKVETFIETLKNDEIGNVQVPDFNDENISELLQYREDDLNISNYPKNPLSSFILDEVSVGMYVLWTIESIRQKEIEDPNFYLFASLNPMVIKRSTGEAVDQDAILPELAEAYFDWWNSSKSIEEKLQINPLEGLGLRWK